MIGAVPSVKSLHLGHEDFFVDRLEQHMSSEWAPMSIRAAVQSRGGYDVKKFSKRLGGLVHPPDWSMFE